MWATILGILLGLVGTATAFETYDRIITPIQNTSSLISYQEIGASDDPYDIVYYNALELSGVEVIDLIKRMQYSYKIAVHTNTASVVYPNSDFSVVNVKGTTNYINPDSIFISELDYDVNGMVYGINITMKDMIASTVDSLDFSKVKDETVAIIQEGLTSNSTWEEISKELGIKLNLLKDKNSDLDSEIEYLRNQLINMESTYNLALGDKKSEVDMDKINREIEKIFDFNLGEVVVWTQGRDKMQEIFDLKSRIASEVASLESMLTQDQFRLIYEERNVVLVGLLHEISVKSEKLAELQKLYAEYVNVTTNDIGNFNSNSKEISQLETKIKSLVTELNSLLSSIKTLKVKLQEEKNKLTTMTTDRDNQKTKYNSQVTESANWTTKLNTAKQLLKTNTDKYNAEVIKLDTAKAENTILTNDRNDGIAMLKQAIGTGWNTSLSVATNVSNAYTEYKSFLTQLGLTASTTLAQYSDSLNISFGGMKTAVVNKGGYVSALTQTGIKDGVLSIPQGLSSVGHTHNTNCYLEAHTHGTSCYTKHSHSDAQGCYKDTSVYCSGNWSNTTYHSYDIGFTCSKCGGGSGRGGSSSSSWTGSTTCTTCGTDKYTSTYSYVTATNTISTCSGCSYISSGDYGFTGLHGWEFSSDTICTINTATQTLTCTQPLGNGALVCDKVALQADIISNPVTPTERNATLNRNGLVVAVSYLDGSLKYMTTSSLTITNVTTNTAGTRNGTITIPTAAYKGNTRTSFAVTFSYTVK